jgi:hypothetical protein
MLRALRLGLASAILVSIATDGAVASASYSFCVSRRSSASFEKFGAKYNFGDLDPGREVARVLVSQKSKQAGTTDVGVTDYNQANCGAIREEANVTMTSEQLGQLGAAIGRVDPVAAATVAAEIAAGITVRTVQEAGKIIGVGKANNYINQRIKHCLR